VLIRRLTTVCCVCLLCCSVLRRTPASLRSAVSSLAAGPLPLVAAISEWHDAQAVYACLQVQRRNAVLQVDCSLCGNISSFTYKEPFGLALIWL